MAINLQKGQRVSLDNSMKLGLAGIRIAMTVVQISTWMPLLSCWVKTVNCCATKISYSIITSTAAMVLLYILVII